jgi:DEAD/DEAH box helicase domain-containing protein
MEGKLFQVERLDFEGRKAYVREIDCDYYTDAITHTRVRILDEFESGSSFGAPGAPPPGARAAALEDSLSSRGLRALSTHGEVHVVSRVVGFKKIKFYTNENVGSGELDLPEQQMHTTSYWLTVPRELMTTLPFAPDDRRDGVVGLSFAMRHVAALLLMCDRHDLGISLNNGDEPSEDDDSRIFLFDNYPGGIGFSEPLFQMHDALLKKTQELIAGCDCEAGCPTCVGPIGDTGPMAKTAALRILDLLLQPR